MGPSGDRGTLWGVPQKGSDGKREVRKCSLRKTKAKGVSPRSFPFGREREKTESFLLLSFLLQKGSEKANVLIF